MQLKSSPFVKFFTSFSFLFIFSTIVSAQNFSGKVFSRKNNTPLEFINIGIAEKGVGTVSDQNGNYYLTLDAGFDNDTLVFSCIGFTTYTVKVSDFKKMSQPAQIALNEKIFQLNEVVIKPRDFVEKILGINTKTKSVEAGFKDNKLGYELGILMPVKKTATLEKVHINIATCTFDTIFCRLNIYKSIGNMQFENILQQPIYINLLKNEVKEEIIIDLKDKNINVEGDCLITLEYIKDLGSGRLYFPAKLLHKTYFRKTSQAKWEVTGKAGISISVDALVEK